ncbi:hypothetical protein ABZ671_01275 [Micromonospora sp. NPDC006766]|uniref:hypothetical protein n=1 Tax=Micromonospora sp. NPDC006766 TaxID=3154778 RepID=UPI0033D768B1
MSNTLDINQTLTYITPDGRVTITVQRVREDVFTVTTYQGTYRVEDNCGSYDDEQVARLIAQGYAVLYRAEHPADPEPEAAEEEPQPEPEPNAFDALAALGELRQVRPTMAGAHLADLTDAGQRAINRHRDGIVRPGGGISRSTLNALERQGYGTLTYVGRSARIDYLTLNRRGLAAVRVDG